MDQATMIINRVLPIFILIGLGYWIRRRAFLTENTINDLRKIAINLGLPAVLFTSFLKMELRLSYIIIFVLLFGLCLLLFGLGRLLKTRLRIEYLYFPFLITGFEYGMMGVSLFGSAYGTDNIGYIAIIDLGHELFIWFVFLAFLLALRDGLNNAGQLVGAFFRSPVIIGILAGLLFNILGAERFLYDSAITGGIMASLDFLGNLLVPVILMIIGYGIRLNTTGIREAAPVIVIRLGILIPLALILNRLVIHTWLGLGRPFEIALFTLLIMPPPFIIPLYMREGVPDEQRYVNNVLMLYTVVSLAIFAVFFVLNPTL